MAAELVLGADRNLGSKEGEYTANESKTYSQMKQSAVAPTKLMERTFEPTLVGTVKHASSGTSTSWQVPPKFGCVQNNSVVAALAPRKAARNVMSESRVFMRIVL